MSIEWFDSFASYNGTGASPGLQKNWTTEEPYGGLSAFSTTPYGRVLRIYGDGNIGWCSARRDFAPKSAFSFGFNFKLERIIGNGKPLFAFYRRNGALLSYTNHGVLAFCITPEGVIEVRIQKGIHSAGTGPKIAEFGPLVAGIEYFIELEHVISDTAGRLKVMLDTKVVVDVRDIDTLGEFDQVDGFLMTTIAWGNNGLYNSYIGNVWIDSNPVSSGPKRVAILAPNADLGSSGFSPSTGSTLYECVDEAPVSTADSIMASAPGDQAIFGFPDANLEDIYAVSLNTWISKTDAQARSVRISLLSGGANVNTGSLNIPTTIDRVDLLANTDPATAAPWTLAAINALTSKIEVTA